MMHLNSSLLEVANMSKAGQLAVFVILFASLGQASNPCPVTPVNGTDDLNAFAITFRNAGKLPIRRLEFNCNLAQLKTHKVQTIQCSEKNALFFPGTEYTVRYPYPDGVPRPVLVSLKSATTADEYIWKPSRREPCRTLHIVPKRTRK